MYNKKSSFNLEKYNRKPDFIKIKIPHNGQKDLFKLKNKLNINKLTTVCVEAKCPNLTECWSQNTATIMILGDVCTRSCKFCKIKTGNPKGLVDKEEPFRVANLLTNSKLDYVVITCVDRDDIKDGGAGIFAETIRQIKIKSPDMKIEALISDYQGQLESLKTLVCVGPDVIAHNMETVESLTPTIRDRRAKYRQSLELLGSIKELNENIITKSSLMVGLGETRQELNQTCIDLRKKNVDIITFGQYLRPSLKHISVKRYYSLQEFKELELMSRNLGFIFVASGPLVRSSYRAAELFTLNHLENTY